MQDMLFSEGTLLSHGSSRSRELISPQKTTVPSAVFVMNPDVKDAGLASIWRNCQLRTCSVQTHQLHAIGSGKTGTQEFIQSCGNEAVCMARPYTAFCFVE